MPNYLDTITPDSDPMDDFRAITVQRAIDAILATDHTPPVDEQTPEESDATQETESAD